MFKKKVCSLYKNWVILFSSKTKLMWESRLKLKMIENDNRELLKLLQVFQMMEKKQDLKEDKKK